jgi:hypothetical protein
MDVVKVPSSCLTFTALGAGRDNSNSIANDCATSYSTPRESQVTIGEISYIISDITTTAKKAFSIVSELAVSNSKMAPQM